MNILEDHDQLCGLKLSVVIIARNEEKQVGDCLKSVAWASERVVVDDHSTDQTVQIAVEHGARVVSHSFETFAKQRNWALENAGLTNDWVLMLDADERGTESLCRSLSQVLASDGGETVAYRMCRRTIFHGRWVRYSDGFPVWIMRLVRRDRVRFVDSGHGEVPVPQVDGRMGTIREPFDHYPFSKGLEHWLARHVRYAAAEAMSELQLSSSEWTSTRALFSRSSAERRRTLRQLSRKIPFRPTLRFLYQYLLKGGILDGRAGFDFCRLMAIYEAMIVSIKRSVKKDGA